MPPPISRSLTLWAGSARAGAGPLLAGPAWMALKMQRRPIYARPAKPRLPDTRAGADPACSRRMEQITSTPLVVHEFADFPSPGSNLGTETKKQSIFTSSYRNGVQGEMGLGQGGVQREGGRKPGGGVVLRVNPSSRGGIHCGIHY